jgi:hypothetical protein
VVDLLDDHHGEQSGDHLDRPDGHDAAALEGRAAVTRTMPPRPGSSSRGRVLPPLGAVAGAAVAVAGVALGIGTLLCATQAPVGDPAAAPASAGQAGSTGADSFGNEPAVALPDEATPAPDDPPPAPEEQVGAQAEPVPTPAAAPVPEPVPEPAAAPAPPAVLVLNNSRISGLAEQAAARFEAEGWPVHDTGGLRGRIRATTVYYPPGERTVAQAFAERFPGVERVLPRLAGLPGSGLTVVVTRDFST